MNCVGCSSAAVTERDSARPSSVPVSSLRYAVQQAQRRVLNRASVPSDIIAFVVFCRLRCRLTLRDLSEIMLLRRFTVSHDEFAGGRRSCCR